MRPKKTFASCWAADLLRPEVRRLKNEVPEKPDADSGTLCFRDSSEKFVFHRSRVKAHLFEMMQMDREFTGDDEERLNPTHQV